MTSLRRRPVRHLIGGMMADSDSESQVINPATGETCARCVQATREQLDEAVLRAREALPEWASRSPQQRREGLMKMTDLLRANKNELAALIALEQGKPLAAAQTEVMRSALLLENLLAIDLVDEVIRDDASGHVVVRYRPLGVVGAITPWNMPVALSVPKISHALYTGNTIVLKPSPYTPLTALRLGELAKDIFPPGVLNVTAGANEFGQWMSEHPGIDKISFTGSIATGRKVMASAAGNFKRLTLELGGNDPAIVLDDADVPAIARNLYDAAFVNCGQVCMAIKRLYVPDELYEQTCEAIATIARGIRVGDPFDPETQLGPVQNLAQFQFVKGVLEEARSRSGTRILSGGHAIDGPGYFLRPTVVAGVSEGARIVDEEQFGPLLPIIRYSDLGQVIERANRSHFGLGASVWGTDVERAAKVANRLHAGVVWVNRHVGADPLAPFGGAKQSGIGRQFGVQGLRGYMEGVTVFLPPRLS